MDIVFLLIKNIFMRAGQGQRKAINFIFQWAARCAKIPEKAQFVVKRKPNEGAKVWRQAVFFANCINKHLHKSVKESKTATR
jgi:hypothetical protein